MTTITPDQIRRALYGNVLITVPTPASSSGGAGSVNFSAGVASANLGSVTFADANNVSFGLAGGVITAIANTVGGGAITNIKFSAGTYSTYRSDITFGNSNGVSFGQDAAGVITATVATNYQSQGAYLTTAQPPGAYLTTAALSQDSSKYAGTAGSISGGSMTLNTSGLTIDLPAYLTTAQPPGAYLTTAALSQDSSKYAGTGFTTASTAGTDIVGTLGTNGLSMGVPAYLTTAAGSGAGTGFTSASTAGTDVVGTLDTNGLSMGIPAYLTTAQPPGAYLTTAALSQDSSKYAGTGFTSATTAGTNVVGTLGTNGLSVGVPAYLTAAITATSFPRLDQVLDPTADKLFSMGSNQLQLSWATGGSFSTNATRQGFFELDLAGNLTQEADLVHLHQHGGAPTLLDILHIEADGANVTGIRAQMAASIAAELNMPIKFTTRDTNYSIGSVPMILGTGMSNVVSNLNAYYLQGSQASQFQSAGAYLTTAQPVGNYAGTGTSVVTTAGTDLTMALNTGGLTVAYPKWITTYVNDLTSGRAGVNTSVATTAGTDLTLGVNTSGVTIGYPKWITTYVNDLTSQRAGTNTSVQTTAGTDLSCALNTSGLTIAYPAWITTYVNDLTSARAGMNTSVVTTAGTDLSFAVNTSGVTIAYPKWITTYVNDLTSDRAGTVTGATGCSVTANTSGISVNVPAAAGATVSVYPDLVAFPDLSTVSTYYSGSMSQGAGGNSTASSWTFSLYFVPMVLPCAVAFSQIRLIVSEGTAAGTGSATQIFSLGFYTNNASTLSLSKSYCAGIVLSQNSSNAWTYSIGTATTAGQSSNAAGLVGISLQSYISSQGNLNSSLLLNGSSKLFRIDVPATTLPSGQYWMAFGNALRTSGAAVLSLAGLAQCPGVTQRSTGFLDCGANTSASAPMFGSGWGAIATNFSSSSNAATWWPMPSAVALSNIVSDSTAVQRYHFPILRNQ